VNGASAAGGRPPIDLRSDTVTRPSPAMRQAMAEAEVGDDVYGDDPTINELEREVAGLFGYPAALFTPSGSMANQIGLRLLVKPGQELVCDHGAHVVRSELGAAAAFSGITTRTWLAERGLLDPELVAQVITPNMPWHQVSTAAIAVENTHNFGGGTVQPPAAVREVVELGRRHGLGLHLDGARIWNAHVATGLELIELAEGFDTVSVCLSKGLGAPVGSLLMSSVERIAEARIWRKRYGGGMRQAGILAAAGLYAVRNNIKRLADDHDRTRRLAAGLDVDPAGVDTNILVLRVPDTGRIAQPAAEQGVLVSVLGSTVMRLVTHLDIDDDAIDRAIEVLRPLIRG
jgi:threonine aldolase